jgi:hypothetical protein
MKSYIIVCFILLSGLHVFGQKDAGPVLKKELAGKYEGELKKGLAHGQGTAVGLDSYTGHFSKGLPEGQGTYTFSNQDVYKGEFSKGLFSGKGLFTFKKAVGDSILEGYWDAGKYVGKTKVEPYEISNKTGGVNPSIIYIGEGNKVEIVVMDPYNKYIIPQIMAFGQFTQQTYYARNLFADAVFPLSFDIRYNCTNKMRSGVIANTINIKINKPGNWQITLHN